MMVNALDYYGTWKLFDGLIDAAFTGKNRDYALGNTPQQRFMGLWSDGVPVKVLDLGIAKLLEVTGQTFSGLMITKPWQAMGTAPYMPPEQWGERPRDGRIL